MASTSRAPSAFVSEKISEASSVDLNNQSRRAKSAPAFFVAPE
jgi:hypothetical protein